MNRLTNAATLATSSSTAVTSPTAVKNSIRPGSMDATIAVPPLPITAPNHAGSSRTDTGRSGEPVWAMAQVLHRQTVPGERHRYTQSAR